MGVGSGGQRRRNGDVMGRRGGDTNKSSSKKAWLCQEELPSYKNQPVMLRALALLTRLPPRFYFSPTFTMSTGTPSASASVQAQANNPGSETPNFSSIGVRNTTINCADGVNLTAHQKLLVGSVLDVD